MKLQKYYLSVMFSLLVFQTAFSQTEYESAYSELRNCVYNSNSTNEYSVKDKYEKIISLLNNDNSLNKKIEKSK